MLGGDKGYFKKLPWLVIPFDENQLWHDQVLTLGSFLKCCLERRTKAQNTWVSKGCSKKLFTDQATVCENYSTDFTRPVVDFTVILHISVDSEEGTENVTVFNNRLGLNVKSINHEEIYPKLIELDFQPGFRPGKTMQVGGATHFTPRPPFGKARLP